MVGRAFAEPRDAVREIALEASLSREKKTRLLASSDTPGNFFDKCDPS